MNSRDTATLGAGPRMAPDLFKRCREARRAKTFSTELLAELMEACGRYALAAAWRREDPHMVDMKHTGLEFYFREARRWQAGKVR